MNRLDYAPDEISEVSERSEVSAEKRKLVVGIVSVSCIALIFVIGASIIKKIAVGQGEHS